MGRPKPLLEWEGRPLVARAVDAAAAGGADPVIVVLGAEAERIGAALANLPAHPVFNPDWATGMASSIRIGLAAVLAAAPDIPAVLVALCDQPGLTAEVVSRLAERQTTSGRIAAARYRGRNGAPAVFGRNAFPELAALAGDAGARALLNGDPSRVESLDLPELGVDLDTPADLAAWAGRIR
jgi:molybdenum cofactor cytidylyltransferase